jgi:hypothetical protein
MTKTPLQIVEDMFVANTKWIELVDNAGAEADSIFWGNYEDASGLDLFPNIVLSFDGVGYQRTGQGECQEFQGFGVIIALISVLPAPGTFKESMKAFIVDHLELQSVLSTQLRSDTGETLIGSLILSQGMPTRGKWTTRDPDVPSTDVWQWEIRIKYGAS